jgi:uncharacterized protein
VSQIPTSRIRAFWAHAIPSRSNSVQAFETLAIGGIGGVSFVLAGLPGGLISGAMIAVGVASMMGRPLRMPPLLAQAVLVLLGISLGSLMSRQLLQHVSSYPLTIGLLAAATFCTTLGSSYYLQRIHGWDRTSAFLAASPGALSQITILAIEKGADVSAIAVVQTMRVIVLTAALPLLLMLTGMTSSSAPTLTMSVASPLGLIGLIGASVSTALLLRIAKFPASWMFGAMIGSSVLHGTGLIEGGLPPLVRSIALIGIGTLIGSRFARMKTSTLLGHINAALGAFAIAIVISAIFVAVIALTTTVRLADILVAYAPGAMDAMLALALTLHIDPIFVGAHHLSRFVFVTIATPGIVHLFGRPQEDVDD